MRSKASAAPLRRAPPARLRALAAAAVVLCAASPARADVVDLSEGGSRRDTAGPATFILKAEGGSTYSPYGYAGGALSYYNDFTQSELEVGAGGGFPGLQLGVSIRKLFGDQGDYFVFEISIAGNTKQVRGQDPLNPTQGTHVWSNLGIGFEHRAGIFSIGVSGGGTFISFTQTPGAYVHGGVGIGF